MYHGARDDPHCDKEDERMVDDKSGPAEGVKGVVEDVKGKAKEAAGASPDKTT
ncbi:hypothetical protein Rhow_008101 [Rhodococcus wratislaviensis]|uniref:CsbD-like domain-containing protein n=1 Tax=Rhodococcus wratislaviensis TaxID=44752 RepID=A0A402CJM5_RHOWR|nr:hypothetical protein Rhow_008101 [Rhodococcus wratislaviensis]